MDVAENNVEVKMTLTFAGCGMGPYIAQQAEWRLAEIDSVEDINVELTFDPPWTPDMITDEGKKLLGWTSSAGRGPRLGESHESQPAGAG